MSFWKRIFGGRQPAETQRVVNPATGDSGSERTSPPPVSETSQGSNIAGVKVLLYLNAPGVRQMESAGVQWRLGICSLMAKQFGSQSDLQRISSKKWMLSEIAKARCVTTPIYRDKQGGICVLFEALDTSTCQREGLTQLGTIDPAIYAGFLCEKFNISPEDVSI
jgi:hypothetical protein